MKDWFKKNYPGKDWKKDLTINERGIAKEKNLKIETIQEYWLEMNIKS